MALSGRRRANQANDAAMVVRYSSGNQERRDKAQGADRSGRQCIICGSDDAPIVWFQSLYFCGEDNELFTKLYYECVLAPRVEGLESPPISEGSSKKKRRTAHYLTIARERERQDNQDSS